MNVGETQAAAVSASNERAPLGVENRLMELWPQIENQLLQTLEARMRDRTKNLQKFLDDRAEREVANVTSVIQELERSIRETLTDKEDPQLKLEWSDGEKQQRERDIGSLRSRLLELPSELAREIEQAPDVIGDRRDLAEHSYLAVAGHVYC